MRTLPLGLLKASWKMKALLHIAVYFIYQCFLISAQITGDSDVQCNDKLIQQILDQQQLILDKIQFKLYHGHFQYHPEAR